MEQVVVMGDDGRMGTEDIIETLRKKFERVSGVLDERSRRVWAMELHHPPVKVKVVAVIYGQPLNGAENTRLACDAQVQRPSLGGRKEDEDTERDVRDRAHCLYFVFIFLLTKDLSVLHLQT
ncbi:MAG: hypothetical protein WAN46_17900 [Gammaproteobacteria bacterium]